jgi:nitroreductase
VISACGLAHISIQAIIASGQQEQTMNFLELAEKRISVRGYLPEPVDEAALAKVLAAARLAPSAANRQPWHIIVVRDTAARRDLAAAYPRDWFQQAPLLLAVCVEPAKAWVHASGKNFADVDGAIMMDHITLCAASLGLGTCWVAAFDRAKAKSALLLPDGIEPLALTPLGRPNDAGRPKTRKPLTEIIHHDRW